MGEITSEVYTIILGIVSMLALFYVLYINGFMIWNNRRALMFIGSLRGDGACKARFNVCSGVMKRVIRFKESKVYHFNLDINLTEGSLEVRVLDKDKNVVVLLDHNTCEYELMVESKKRYYLVFEFKKASGEYVLEWK